MHSCCVGAALHAQRLLPRICSSSAMLHACAPCSCRPSKGNDRATLFPSPYPSPRPRTVSHTRFRQLRPLKPTDSWAPAARVGPGSSCGSCRGAGRELLAFKTAHSGLSGPAEPLTASCFVAITCPPNVLGAVCSGGACSACGVRMRHTAGDGTPDINVAAAALAALRTKPQLRLPWLGFHTAPR